MVLTHQGKCVNCQESRPWHREVTGPARDTGPHSLSQDPQLLAPTPAFTRCRPSVSPSDSPLSLGTPALTTLNPVVVPEVVSPLRAAQLCDKLGMMGTPCPLTTHRDTPLLWAVRMNDGTRLSPSPNPDAHSQSLPPGAVALSAGSTTSTMSLSVLTDFPGDSVN